MILQSTSLSTSTNTNDSSVYFVVVVDFVKSMQMWFRFERFREHKYRSSDSDVRKFRINTNLLDSTRYSDEARRG